MLKKIAKVTFLLATTASINTVMAQPLQMPGQEPSFAGATTQIAPPVPMPPENATLGMGGNKTKAPSLPGPSESMAVDHNAVMQKENNMISQADARVAQVINGNNKNTTDSNEGELKEIARIQEQIQLLDAKQALADRAVKYWATVNNSQPDKPATPTPAAVTTTTPQAPTNKNNSDAGFASVEQQLPFPKIVSIIGGGRLKATLLVPYVGEVEAHIGTVLPGNRQVTSITTDGVQINDPKIGSVSLGFGDSVAATQTPALGGGLINQRVPVNGIR